MYTECIHIYIHITIYTYIYIYVYVCVPQSSASFIALFS